MAAPKKADPAALFERDDVDTELTIRPKENPAQRAARLREEARAAAHRRRMEWTFLGFLAFVALPCLYLAVSPHTSDDRAKWAMTILGSIVTTGLGFIAGRATK